MSDFSKDLLSAVFRLLFLCGRLLVFTHRVLRQVYFCQVMRYSRQVIPEEYGMHRERFSTNNPGKTSPVTKISNNELVLGRKTQTNAHA